MRTNRTLAALLIATLIMPAASALADSEVKRGEYLAGIMDCGGCHNPGAFLGKPDMSRLLAGSEVGFQIPEVGTFFPPNITPDRATGIGEWTEEQIIAAVRTGTRPDGRVLAPIMPWRSYSVLNDADAAALAKYLKSIPPISNTVTEIAGPGEKPKGLYFTIVKP